MIIIGGPPDLRRERLDAAVKAVRARWQQEEFELWGRREERLGAPERIDDAVPPEMREERHTDLDPRDHGTLQYWQDPLRRSPAYRWFLLHFVLKSVAVAEVTEPPGKLTRNEAIEKIIAEGKVPGNRGYPDKLFETEVRGLCGVGEETKGYSRRALRRIYQQLKKGSK